ncbi:MAG TPA: tetratricopeptide repeat protein [Anaerolineae bacterium]|nr:tetratricopeptide repeat protein [Anaerolineae bacterium]
MRLREIVILAMLLCALSAVIGAGVLFYLYVWRQPPVAQVSPGTVTIEMPVLSAGTAEASASPEPLPELVTPTRTETPPPTPSPTPTATPTFTPSPTPSPTVTPQPANSDSLARLANAHRAKRYGDYRLARTEFRSVLETSEDEDVQREALYQLGVCALLDAEYAAAEVLLLQFLDQNADDPRAVTAHYYLAQALEGLARYDSARDHYLAYLARQDVLADLVYTQIADGAALQGNYEVAVEAYERAIERAPDLSQQYDLREKLGLAYSAWGRFDQAVEWLHTITEDSQNVHRLARIWYLIGQIHRLAGREEQALDAFAQAVQGDPRPGYAHAALVALVEAFVEVDEFQRGLINYYAGSYSAAVAAFSRYMEATPEYDSDAHYYVALSYLADGFPDLAVQECDGALDAFPETVPHWGDLWLIRARALAAQERTSDAVAAYLAFADANRDHSQAPEAYWEAAWLLEQEGQLAEAADVYTSLADRHVNDERAPAARFRAGITRYRVGDLDAALATWRELVNGYPASAEALGGRYWIGRVLWMQAEEQQAREMLQLLADQHPRDYYGLRAAHLLASNGQPPHWPSAPQGLHLTADGAALEQEVWSWVREWAGTDQDVDLTAVHEKLSASLHFRRAMELVALGKRDAARDEFEELRQANDQDPVALYQLAIVTRDLGIYAPSLRAAIDLMLLAPEESVLDMPVRVRQLLFPAYFPDLVLAESQAYNVDPLLMFALIRQESLFDDQIASWAGAVGLAQIMPSTGEWIAETMPWPEYEERDLRRAYLNARFGAWFMSRILDMTEGDVAAALAGYNGGPANALRWLEASGGDPDLFVEIVDREEPKRYVREIYRHYDVYVRLYGGQPETYALDPEDG